MIKEIPFDEFVPLYQEHIRSDFPRAERRPLSAIKRMYRKSRYTCCGLYDGESLLAYATFIHDVSFSSVLLDYFAVLPTLRGGGTGSRFLRELLPLWEKDGIILECETPDTAADEADRLLRTRRIAFYERSGAQVSRWKWRAFSVDYNLLWLPIRRPMDEETLAKDIRALYAVSMPPFWSRLFTRLTWED